MMHVLVFGERFVDVRRALAKQYIVIADVETRHARVAEPAEVLEAEQIAVKFFRFIETVDRNRPVGDAFDFQ